MENKKDEINQLCELLQKEKQLDVSKFMHQMYSLNLVDHNYMETLESYSSMDYFELVDQVNQKVLLAILSYAMRLERSYPGALDSFVRNGNLVHTLTRLKDLNDVQENRI